MYTYMAAVLKDGDVSKQVKLPIAQNRSKISLIEELFVIRYDWLISMSFIHFNHFNKSKISSSWMCLKISPCFVIILFLSKQLPNMYTFLNQSWIGKNNQNKDYRINYLYKIEKFIISMLVHQSASNLLQTFILHR